MENSPEREASLEKPKLFIFWHSGLRQYWMSAIGLESDDAVQEEITKLLGIKLKGKYLIECRGNRVEVSPEPNGERNDKELLGNIAAALSGEYALPEIVDG